MGSVKLRWVVLAVGVFLLVVLLASVTDPVPLKDCAGDVIALKTGCRK